MMNDGLHKRAGIVKKAVDVAPSCKGLTFGSLQLDDVGSVPGHVGYLKVKYKNQARNYQVIVVKQLYRAAIDRLIADRNHDQPVLLVSKQINSVHADQMVASDISFLDMAGNAYIDVPGLHLYVVGRKTASQKYKTNIGKLFQPSGLKLIFAFITDPDLDKSPQRALLNQTFRNINSQTGVALGSIGNRLKDMTDLGYIINDQDVRYLSNRKQLLQKWVDAYGDRFRSKLINKRYRSNRSDWWQGVDIAKSGGLWGGELAASILTGYLKPQKITIYAKDLSSSLFLDADLRRDPDGDVDILDPFWGDNGNIAVKGCTHPFLVYADLLCSDMDRNRDAASRVYDDYLRKIIEPD